MDKKNKILIIEDNESLLLLMNHFFSKEYEVYSSKNGLDAMSWLRKGILPDIILLDWEMPMMGGQKFLEGLRSSGLFRDIPAIIISSNQKEEICENSNVEYYFEKPFDPKELKSRINQALIDN